jgi:hypothetical protein
MLSLPIFCMSSKFFIVIDLSLGPIAGGYGLPRPSLAQYIALHKIVKARCCAAMRAPRIDLNALESPLA